LAGEPVVIRDLTRSPSSTTASSIGGNPPPTSPLRFRGTGRDPPPDR